MRHTAFALLAATMFAAPALAQSGWVPGMEIVGQSVQVETNGVVNTVHFDPGGAARIVTPGGRVVPASWTSNGGQLCLLTGASRECWAYQAPLQAGQQVAMTSSCNVTSRWLANATNPMPQPQQQPSPVERG